MILLDRVAETLEAAGVPFALIGASALAVHGVCRSTFDHDLLTTSPLVLDQAFWRALPPRINVEVKVADTEDPLAGFVAFSAPGDRDVDLIVGRTGWMDGVLARRVTAPLAGRDLPVADAGDLILLKLYAGGRQDAWDVEQLLAASPAPSVREDVESRLSELPPYSGLLWQRLTTP